ncbi:MAG: NADH-quinone oxidoreductase subunit J, partial [Planctomycetes bacterium]|nr:NADH-quinone oxidoreductase subunit J [Planctomycetota bacterium]
MGIQLAFYFFAAMTLGFALVSLFHKNVVHSAFSLLGTLLGMSGLYVTLNADFLAMTQVLIYAGGILMLLLFGLMLTKPSETERSLKRIFVAVILAGGTAVLSAYKMAGTVWSSGDGELPASTVKEIGLEFLRFDEWLIAF